MSANRELATRFEQAHNELIELLAPLDADDWRAVCGGEGWSVGVTAHHIAASYGATLHYVPAMMSGEIAPLTWDNLHQANAMHAEQFAGVTRDETIELLRADGQRVSAWLAGLHPDELAQTIVLPLAGDEPVTLQAIVEGFLIGHIAGHRASIEAAIEE